ncbi:hypothetical protein BTVI_152766 [Pitangus sulphuratus]|nr:hypothetical protein BTVI_152766 [Pitangus sulphuratus]
MEEIEETPRDYHETQHLTCWMAKLSKRNLAEDKLWYLSSEMRLHPCTLTETFVAASCLAEQLKVQLKCPVTLRLIPRIHMVFFTCKEIHFNREGEQALA